LKRRSLATAINQISDMAQAAPHWLL